MWDRYFAPIYGIVFFIGLIVKGLSYLVYLVEVGNNGEFGTALLMLILGNLLVPLEALIFAIFWGTIVAVLGILPYSIYRYFAHRD